MNESKREELWLANATGRAKLLRDAAQLIAAGDPELLRARAACIAAMRQHEDAQASRVAMKCVRDVSWFEMQAALTAEVAAHMALSAAEDAMVALMARRHRLALQKEGLAGG